MDRLFTRTLLRFIIINYFLSRGLTWLSLLVGSIGRFYDWGGYRRVILHLSACSIWLRRLLAVDWLDFAHVCLLVCCWDRLREGELAQSFSFFLSWRQHCHMWVRLSHWQRDALPCNLDFLQVRLGTGADNPKLLLLVQEGSSTRHHCLKLMRNKHRRWKSWGLLRLIFSF